LGHFLFGVSQKGSNKKSAQNKGHLRIIQRYSHQQTLANGAIVPGVKNRKGLFVGIGMMKKRRLLPTHHVEKNT